MLKHKSEDFKMSAVEYYLTEDILQERVCKIFKCSPRRLNLIDTKFYHNVKLHKLKDYKRFMLSKKVKYTYPHKYNYEDINKCEHNHYPSIFYYIYKKTN
jgi:hypothetical protein